MPDIPRDLGVLAKSIQNYRVESSSDLRDLTERCRAMCMDVAAILDVAEFEVRSALAHYDGGNSRRARSVTRPFRHAETLATLAGRRCVQVYKQYLKVFGDQIRTRQSGRRFDPQK